MFNSPECSFNRGSNSFQQNTSPKAVEESPFDKTTTIQTESAEEYNVLSFSQTIKQGSAKSNLTVMALIWLCATIDYVLLMLSFQTHETYEKSTISASTDIVGIGLSLLLYSKLGSKFGL